MILRPCAQSSPHPFHAPAHRSPLIGDHCAAIPFCPVWANGASIRLKFLKQGQQSVKYRSVDRWERNFLSIYFSAPRSERVKPTRRAGGEVAGFDPRGRRAHARASAPREMSLLSHQGNEGASDLPFRFAYLSSMQAVPAHQRGSNRRRIGLTQRL